MAVARDDRILVVVLILCDLDQSLNKSRRLATSEYTLQLTRKLELLINN